MGRKIWIFDTTLRDGEQSPGASMNADEKLKIAAQLLRLNVDIIEAGFPVSSPGDFESTVRIAELVGDKAVVTALSRAVDRDIDVAAEALANAKRPRIHTGLGVSPQHLVHKLRISEEEAIDLAVHAVRHARNLVDDVQFYAEDAGRSSYEFLARICEATIAAGASTINIPDTTGFNMPDEFGARIKYLMEHVAGIENVTVAVHCHNDLGMATALALEGVRNGATQVECTINGLGERAGNTALEEVVMAIKLHGEELDAYTDIVAKELTRTSKLVANVSGIYVQPNKAIVGSNAFRHSSGIHQDGVIKDPSTYEIITPESVGATDSAILLTARSGKAAVAHKIEELGYTLDEEAFNAVFNAFIELADKKKEVYDEDLEALVEEFSRSVDSAYKLKSIQVSTGYPLTPTATLCLVDREGEEHIACVYGTGPIDAAFKAVNEIIQAEHELIEFSINSITRGIDALGEAALKIRSANGKIYTGRGADGDIIVSSTRAYLNALNHLVSDL